jgi:phage gp36-like protein
MEKRVNVHKQPWKLLSGNPDKSNIERASMALRDVQDSIDEYLEQRKTNPQHEGQVLPIKKPGKYS